MDIGNASLLAFSIFLLAEFFKELFPTASSQLFLAFIIAAGQLVAVGVAHSDWGVKTVVSGIPLNAMNWVSLAFVGLACAGLAAGANKVLVKAVSKIGSSDSL